MPDSLLEPDASIAAKRAWIGRVLNIELPGPGQSVGKSEEKLFGRKKKTPVTSTTPPLDRRAAQIANDLVYLHGEAVNLGSDLGGQRDTIKGQVEEQVLAQRFDDAERGISRLRDLLDAASSTARQTWEQGGFAAAAQSLKTLLADGDPQAGILERARSGLQGRATKGQFILANEGVANFVAAVDARTKLYPARKAWLDAADDRAATAKAVDEAIGWGADLTEAKRRLAAIEKEASDERNNYADLTEEHDEIAEKIGKEHPKFKQQHQDWVAAAPRLATVEQQIAEAVQAALPDAATLQESLTQVKRSAAKPDLVAALRELNLLAPLAATAATTAGEKRLYETQREALALDEAAVMRIPDSPGALKDLKDKFVASRTLTEQSVTGNDFATAITSLTKLKQDLKAALDAKRTEFEKATKTKVDSIDNKLQAEGTGGKQVWENVGSTAWKSAVDDIVALKVDEDFDASYDAKSTEVASKLAKDPIVMAAYDNWTTWTMPPPKTRKINKLMERVVAIQSEVLGIDPATPTETFNDRAQPDLCGQYTRSTNKISLNIANPGFKDFRELLDTLTHENTHAYQAKLMKQLADGTIGPGHPEYSAAMIFTLNTNAGYITSDEAATYPASDAYNRQPKEVHAWRAGRVAGQAAFAAIRRAKTGG